MWMTPIRMHRRPGTPGRIAVVIDISGSMYGCLQIAAAEFRNVAKTLPRGFKLIAFGDRACEMSVKRFERIAEGFIDMEANDMIGGGTTIASGMEYAAGLDPQTTILISDGRCIRSDASNCLKIAGRMTGAIFAFECGAGSDYDLLAKLARIGNGRCVPLDGSPGVFRAALRDVLKDVPTEEPVMARKELPDYMLESDQFEFVAPEDELHDLRKRIKVITGTIVDVEHREPEITHHGSAVQQRLVVEPNRSQITKPQSIFRSLFSAPQMDTQEESYRGKLREASPTRALPAPNQPLALPAPQAYSPPAIADQRGGEMDERERVAVKFRRG